MNIHNKALTTVHLTAAAGAATVAILLPPADAFALRAEEIGMILKIGKLYGIKMTRSAAKGLFISGFAQLVGEKAALTALEGANLAGPAAYPIKASIAVSLIEAVGYASIRHFEGSKPAAIACGIMEGLGAAHDIVNTYHLITDSVSCTTVPDASSSISFGHMSTPASSIRKAAKALQEGKSMNYVMSYLKDAAQKLYPNLSDSEVYDLALDWYHKALQELSS